MKRFELKIWTGVVILTVTLHGSSLAQEKTWTLEECIRTALTNNIALNQSRISNEIYEYNLESARADRIPSLSISGSQSWNFGRSVDPLTNEFTTNTYDNTRLNLSSSLTLFNGMQTINTIRRSRNDIETGMLNLEEQENNLILNVSQAYLSLLYSYEEVGTAEKTLESTKAQEERTRRLVEVGQEAQSNLYQLNAQMASDQYSLNTARNQLSLNKLTLMQLMEIPLDEQFEIERPDVDNMLLRVRSDYNARDIYEKALEIMPQVENAEIGISSAQLDVKIAKGNYMPRLSLSGSLSSGYSNSSAKYDIETSFTEKQIGYLASNPAEAVLAIQPLTTQTEIAYPLGNQLSDNFAQSLSLSLSIPIFSQMNSKTSVKQREISYRNAELNARDTENQLRKNVEQAYNDYSSAQKNLESAKESLEYQDKSFSDAEKKYELGMINATEYLIQKTNQTTAEINLIRAKYECIFTAAILGFYETGTIIF